jgi:hypothetical protein
VKIDLGVIFNAQFSGDVHETDFFLPADQRKDLTADGIGKATKGIIHVQDRLAGEELRLGKVFSDGHGQVVDLEVLSRSTIMKAAMGLCRCFFATCFLRKKKA